MKTILHPARSVTLAFLAVITVGTLLLMLPAARADGTRALDRRFLHGGVGIGTDPEDRGVRSGPAESQVRGAAREPRRGRSAGADKLLLHGNLQSVYVSFRQ